MIKHRLVTAFSFLPLKYIIHYQFNGLVLARRPHRDQKCKLYVLELENGDFDSNAAFRFKMVPLDIQKMVPLGRKLMPLGFQNGAFGSKLMPLDFQNSAFGASKWCLWGFKMVTMVILESIY